jgi:FkbM family methyltransferase
MMSRSDPSHAHRLRLAAIYEALPFKRELMHVVRRAWTPPQTIYRHLHFKGPFRVTAGGRSFQLIHHGFELENAVFWSGLTGDWEGHSMALWIELCRSADVIYDVGANTGIYALVAKSVNPSAEVHAFEPVARVYDKLVSNDELNGFGVRCVKAALSDKDGTATIFDQPSDHVYSVTVNQNRAPPGTEVFESTIETRRFDTYARASGAGAARPSLMKIDVETHEPEVLSGMGELLGKSRPDLLIEILDDDVGARVETILDGLGYDYFGLDERGGRPRREPHLVNRTPGNWNFLVCKPETAKRLGLDSAEP